MSEEGLTGQVAATPDGMVEAALDMLQAGGPVVVILIAMSILATAVILLKLWRFSRTNVGRRNGRVGGSAYTATRISNP